MRLRRILWIFIALWVGFGTCLAGPADAAWYNPAWPYRQKITILSSLTTGTLTNFPYLVKITDPANPVFTRAQASGNDILFTAADGTTKLSHEIERFDPAAKVLLAWVRVPSISSTVNTDIYLYYGNGSASNQQNVNGTWDSDFVMVNHLHETGSPQHDSTAYGNDGTPVNHPTQGATGKINGADSFELTSDGEVDVPDSASLRVVAMTLEAWVYIPAPLPSTGFHGIVNHGDSGNSNWYQLSYEATGGDQAPNRFHFRWVNGGVRRTDFTAPVSPNTWYYVVGVLNPSTTTAYTYLNGGLDTTVTGASLPIPAASMLYIGRAFSSERFKGTIDEVRISRIARSAAWIGASFRNQNTPDTYTSPGPEQTPPSLWIRGRVFEDKNYGGGAGRSLAASSGIGRPGTAVELYNASGTFLDTATTDAQGDYALGISSAGNYTVRVVNSTVRSSRTGSNGTELGVQTFRTDASTGAASPVTNKVGGEQPQKVDAPANSGSQTLATLQALPGQTTQSIAPAGVSTNNVVGVDFGFNFDTIVNTNNSGQGSLRRFIQNANLLTDDATLNQAGRTAGRETSIFMIPTTDTGYTASPLSFTIRPTSVLDDVTNPVILDGTTQPGFAGSPIIELDGTLVAAGDQNGLTLQAGNSVIRGFVINRYLSDGIEIEIAGTNVVEGNYIGTNVAGTIARPNGYGISVKSNGNVIGGTTSSQRNVISGNTGWGVGLYTTASNNAVRGNYIGLRATGATGLGNSGNGIEVYGTASSSNTIENNVIAGNSQDGVAILDGANIRNAIRENAIYGNGQLGIDLRNDGVSNNNGSINTGRPNYEMDFPVFTNAILDGSTLTVSGYVGSSPNDADFANARVEIFRSDNDPSGNGEGQAYLGFLTANASGNFSGSLTVSGLAVGNRITGTATDGIGNTSEFGTNFVVLAHPCPGWTVSTTADTGVPGTLRECVKEANRYSGITLTVPAGTYTLAIAGDDEDAAATGDLDITAGMTINGAGAGSTIIQAGTNSTNGIDRVFHVDPDETGGFTVSMSNMTIRYGRETGNEGGGILIDQNGTLSFTDGVVTGCTGKGGGGIASLDPSSLTLTRVTVNSNTSTSDGGGVSTLGGYQYTDVAVTGNTAANNGGGIFSDKGSGTLTAVTISGNQANNSRGGGIYSKGSGTMTMTNVTVSGNSASSEGGGICVDGNTSNLTNVTVYNNTGPTGSGIRRRGGTPALRNTIVAGNAAGNCSGMSSSYSSGYNLDDGTTCLFTQTGDIQNQNPTLGGLASNGGYTPTHALLAGSPAIDNATSTGAPVTDQRGVARPQGAGYDIGAYEYSPPATFTVSGTVFEDIVGDVLNDGAIGSAPNPGVPDVNVRLYVDVDGDGTPEATDTYVTTVQTDASGGYSFPGLTSGAKYFVVIDSKSVIPKGGIDTGGGGSATDVWPEQTYGPRFSSCADGAGGSAITGLAGPCYGGRWSGVSDNLGTWYTGAEHIARVAIAAANESNVDFGFSYHAVTTTAGGDNRDDDPAATLRSVQGSLRQFITNANSILGSNAMRFVPTTGPNTGSWWRITVSTALPTVTGSGTTIDGTAYQLTDGVTVRDTNSLGPEVEIRGFSSFGVNGLKLTSANNTVKGLIINGFSLTLSAGIMITGASATGTTVTGNYLGTDYSGTAPVANDIGVAIEAGARSNTVGGTSVAERNVISGNSTYGAQIKDSGTDLNVVKGNYIGTDPAGTTAVANGTGAIIWISAANNTIGGSAVGEGNLISGNNYNGLIIANSGSDSNVVQGNLIGTDAAGTGNLGNGSSGININQGTLNNTIGGTGTREGNTIAFNSGDGIDMNSSGTDGNQVSGNSMFSNTGLGIDLAPNGVTANNGTKDVSRPNDEMDYPIFDNAILSGTTLSVSGYVGSAPGQSTFATARVEIFKADNTPANQNGEIVAGDGLNVPHGEGRTYLGFVTTDANGNFSGSLTVSGVALGDPITGTATDESGNTSEFGPNMKVASGTYGLEGFVYEDVDGDGDILDDGVATGSVVVHLYRDGGDGVPDGADDSLVTTEGTDAGGQFLFGDLSNGIYWIVVDSKTVRPGGATTDVWAEQTYGSVGSVTQNGALYGFSLVAGPLYGGKRREVSDNVATLAGAEHVIRVTVSGADVTGLDFGFSFDVVANTRDGDDDPLNGRTVQGSLRQFLQNANGNVGTRSSVFAIPTTDSNFNAGTNSFLIRPAIPMPHIDRGVRLDASVQAGYDGTPIIDLDGTLAGAGANGFESDSGGSYFRGFAIRNFDGAAFYFDGSGPDTIVGNYIGTDVNGTGAQGNRVGIDLGSGADDTRVGGTAAGEGNIIAFNTEEGIRVTGSASRPILGNSIFGNTGLGIDLGNNGVTPNNGTKNGSLPNYEMDYPVFDNALLSGTTLTVSGYVGSAPGQSTFANARVEIFKADNAPSDQSGEIIAGDGLNVPHGEGRTYLGFVTTDANGNFSDNVTVSGLAAGDSITATATDGSGNTSEFGANYLLVGIADLALIKTDNPDPAASGGDLLYTLLITNNGPGTATGVTLTDVLPGSVTLQSATPSQGSCSGTTTVTCDLGAILSTGTASIEILVVTSGTGTITNNASVTANESDPVPGNNTASVNTNVVVGGTTDIPLTKYRRIHSFVDSTFTGGSLRTESNNNGPCNVGASSTGTLSGIPATATVVGAYLYWAGSGGTVDSQVTLDGSTLTADRTFQARFVLGSTNYDFFGGFKDVTAQVQSKKDGNYTFSGLTVVTGNPYCSSQAVLGGWSMIVIYQDLSLSGKTLVLYDGFDLERNGSTSYLLSGIYATAPPEGKATFLVWEGDSNLGGSGETLVFNGSTLSDGLNPVNNVYNSTINTLGVTTSYGLDLDTFNVSSLVQPKDTLASTTVSVGPDLVILNAVLLQVKSNIITGRVFEDVNYGGGAGRDYATAVAGAPGFSVPRPGAVVELYDSTGTLLRTTTTDADGEYGFAGLIDGDYTVRVPNDNVTSSRPGATGNEKAVQTFRTDASSGSAAAVTNEVGGGNPALQDSPANTTSQNLGSFFSQSKAPAKIITGTAVTNVDFGFSFDTVVNTNDAGQGTLRQILANANALGGDGSLAQSGLVAGKENAVFMISNGTGAPGLRAANNYFSGGVATIAPASALPSISTPMVIDAQKQPGWTLAPIVELNGAGAGFSNGLSINAGGSIVRGFVINRFEQSGIYLSNAGNNTVQGNYLGTNAAGTAQAGNARGIMIITGSPSNIVGGTGVGQRNVISGNTSEGIRIEAPGSDGNVVRGNYIGTDVTGTLALGNQDGIGIHSGAKSSAIGGAAAGEGNVISGNSRFGVWVSGTGTDGHSFLGNRIGTDPAGTANLGNGNIGIYISLNPRSLTIGGPVAGEGNVIAFNAGDGIALVSAGAGNNSNRISGDSIFSNAELGIDLGNDNVTLNDGAKTAGQPNLWMDFPVFTSVVLSGTTLTVSGYVGSNPGQSTFAGARVEVFKSDNDASGHGEGETYLGFLTADASGNFSGSLTVSGLSAGDSITGTATDVSRNTSEFGANATVAAPGTRPDAMIKLASEGAGYLTDDLYEATASTQSKPSGVVSGSTAAYHVLFQNDGNVPDDLVIMGTGSAPGFTVQYLDNTSTDRTAAVTGAGYTVAGLAVGAATTWTVNVTPAGTVVGGTLFDVFVTVVSANDNTKIDQVKAVTTSTSASLTLLKSADKGAAAPGEDITYTVNASNGSGLSAADNVAITDPLDTNTGFKVGGATFNPGGSGLTATAVFSNTPAPGPYVYGYTPVDQGCSAPAGYDYCVTSVRWTTTGSMPTGTAFSVGLVVRVK